MGWQGLAALLLGRAITLLSLLLPLFVNAQTADSSMSLSLVVGGVEYVALVEANQELLERRTVSASAEAEEHAVHYRGSIDGYPDSAVRLSRGQGYWRGLVVYADRIYRVAPQISSRTTHILLEASPLEMAGHSQQLCQTPHPVNGSMGGMRSSFDFAVEPETVTELQPIPSTIEETVFAEMAALAGACPDAVDGICLMPELELAYDQSYQGLFSAGETVLDRATRELNELELFFERSLNYRFSRVTMRFLDAAEDAPFASYSTAGDLLDALRLARNRGELPFIQSPRSIFHFVTGRNFPPQNTPPDSNPLNDVNIVGIAYLDVFCDTFGLNTGVTDAGDAFLVSLVMAHELGHNLGAEHDDPSTNGCSVNTHVMTPSIGASAVSITEFSACSNATIEQGMANTLVSGVQSQCLDFPVDITLVPSPSNLNEPPKTVPFLAEFNLSKQGGSAGVTNVTVQGSVVDPTQGEFSSVSIAGGNCSFDATSYVCQVNNAASTHVVSVVATVDEDADTFEHTQIAGVVSGDGIEFDSTNNSVATTYATFSSDTNLGVTLEPSSGGAGTAASTGGSGGGGAVGFCCQALMLVFLLLKRGVNSCLRLVPLVLSRRLCLVVG